MTDLKVAEVREVAAADWISTMQEAQDAGFTYFDWLGCVDDIGRTDTFTIVLQLRRFPPPEPVEGPAILRLKCAVPRSAPQLPSLRSLCPGAGWHEREAAELFGIEFVDGDRRRLLLAPEFVGTPLRKDEVLAARSAIGWPGAKEPGETEASPSRRRMVPPGVPDPEVWGRRDPAAKPAEPSEVAASAVGGRVRRRPR